MTRQPTLRPRPSLFFDILLIFALVALGMLASACVALNAMAHDRHADLHDVAALHTARLALAMRDNRSYWADTQISPCFSTSGGGVPGCAYLSVPSRTVECAACAARSRAIADLGAWRDRLEAALPQVTLDVACLGGTAAALAGARAGSGRHCSIRIAWAAASSDRLPGTPGQNVYMVRVTP